MALECLGAGRHGEVGALKLVAVIGLLIGAVMIYAGVYNRSLRDALRGKVTPL